MDTHNQADAALRTQQLYFRTRLALANHPDLLPGFVDESNSSPRSWGNASPEMLTGGIHTTPEMRDALRQFESEVA